MAKLTAVTSTKSAANCQLLRSSLVHKLNSLRTPCAGSTSPTLLSSEQIRYVNFKLNMKLGLETTPRREKENDQALCMVGQQLHALLELVCSLSPADLFVSFTPYAASL